SMREHRDFEGVVRTQARLLAPVIVEKVVAVETYELADEPPVRIVGRRGDFEVDGSEVFGKVVGLNRQPADDPEGAAAATLECPEGVGFGACVSDSNLPIGGYALGFKQARRGGAIVLGKPPEAPARDYPRQSDRQASTALDVLPSLGDNR